MRAIASVTVAVAMLTGLLAAQEEKPVPKDSVRVLIPGCANGFVFTAGARTEGQPGTIDISEGMHLRMSGPKKMMAEIKAHEGSMIQITGLIRKGQYKPGGVGIGGGVRIGQGPAPVAPTGGAMTASPSASQILIDVEGWRPGVGDCPSR